MAQKINIKTNSGKIEVSPRCQELKHPDHKKDGVIWEIDNTTLSFTVTFVELSPFGANVFFSNQGKCESGEITSPEPLPTYDHFFRYKIEVPGYDTIDPGIIIWK